LKKFVPSIRSAIHFVPHIPTPFFNNFLYIRRQLRIEKHGLSGMRVFKAEGFGMQRLPGANGKTIFYKLLVFCIHGAFYNFITAVRVVVKKRVAEVFHVNAYLVGAAGFQHTTDQGYVIKTLYNGVVRRGIFSMFSVGISFKEFAVPLVAAYMRFHRSVVFVKVAPHEGPVFALHGMVEKLLGQVPHGFVCFCKHQQSAGVFIDSVYQAKTWQNGFGKIGLFLLQVPGYAIE
jgi:hypothetical protein